MFYHQTENSIGGALYNAYLYGGLNFATHLHLATEIALCISGSLHAEVDGKRYTVREGEALAIFPYRLHSFADNAGSEALVCVFSGEYAASFLHANKGKVPHDPVFAPAPSTRALIREKLMRLGGAEPPPIKGDEAIKLDSPPQLAVKAAVYALLADLADSTEFVRSERDNRLEFQMLSYVENNFLSDITLAGMADALGYDYRYISRIFSKAFGVSFKTLVNQYRCNYAKAEIAGSDLNMSQIALGSGFQSIRSFNRVFRDLEGKSPSSLRE